MKTLPTHSSWETLLLEAYQKLDSSYRSFLEQDTGYFPAYDAHLNAFKTLPRNEVKYILFGQDPYPRRESAKGYAFIDGKVKRLFSDNGLSKEVNRATSLRNFVKMMLVARGDLMQEDTSQEAIQALEKGGMIDSVDALRLNFEKNGVLLLNAALIFTDKQSSAKHVKAWRPFMEVLLSSLKEENPTLILFGNYAKELKKRLPLEDFEALELEHPYNHSFISNEKALEFFGPMKLLDI